MKLSDIQLLYDYNDWANQLMLSKATELPPEQWTQPTGFPWGDLRGTLIHILDTEYSWRNIWQHQRIVPDLAESEAFPTLEAVAARWKEEEQARQAYFSTLNDDAMDSILRYDIPEGRRERVLWHCLVHVVNHGTQHRSECAAMLTSFGYSPGDIDLTLFLNIRAGLA